MKVIEGGVEEQTKQALANLTEVIKAGGSDLANVVKCTVFIKNMVSTLWLAGR
jgi:2-iminobutanoate/2-iminopropanoate deaminase